MEESGKGLSKWIFGSWFFWGCLLVVAIIALLSGCKVNYEKQKGRALVFLNENPNELSKLCADKFSPIYKEGKTVFLKGDTVYVKGDSVKCPDVVNPVTGEKKEGAKVACPPSKTIYVPSVRVDTVESTASLAKIKNLELELEAKNTMVAVSQDNLLEARKQAKNRLWMLIGIGGLIVVYIGLKVKKIIPF